MPTCINKESASRELNVRIDDELGETEDFAAQMEIVPETRLLPLFHCRCPKGRGSQQKDL
jgi:hypothetical protein